jgi:hypothetical protein
MYDGQKIKPLEESSLFDNGLSSRPLVEGTVPRGEARLDDHLYLGRVDGRLVETFPFPVSDQFLSRGRERFETFCSPCHGRLGDGTGMIVQRGFPRPNSFHSDSLRAKPVGHYYDVILNGFGRMYSYAPSVRLEDRWAIVAYIRALQYSRMVDVSDLSESERANLR